MAKHTNDNKESKREKRERIESVEKLEAFQFILLAGAIACNCFIAVAERATREAVKQ